MTSLHPYLTFNGNCREALTFYKNCLGGELRLQTIGELPQCDKMPELMKNCILHGLLIKGSLVIMASDCVPEAGLVKGNSVSLTLDCGSEHEIHEYYKKLSQGGQVMYPIEETFWGALFGGLTDKYGHPWLLNYNKNQNKK